MRMSKLILLLGCIVLTLAELPTINSTCAKGKVNIAITEISGTVQDLFWVKGTKIVFAHTVAGVVYRSTDDGRTWKDEMSRFGSTATFIKSVIRSSQNETIYFTSTGKIFETRDGGKSYSSHVTPISFSEYHVHHTRYDWILASGWSSGWISSYNALYVSQDYGRNWREISSYVHDYAWGIPSKYSTEVHSIWVVEHKTKRGTQEQWPDAKDLRTLRSFDFFRTSTGHGFPENIIQVISLPHVVYVISVDTSLQLWISRDDGENFQKAQYPTTLEQFGFWIVSELEEGVVFMTVAHGTDRSFGTLYVSDDQGYKYTTSMPKQRITGYGPDFARIWGLDGIFMTNSMGHTDEISSKITFDKGASWQDINAPPVYGGTKGGQSANSRLNLFGFQKSSKNVGRAGPMHSRDSAIGLVLGTGNVGEYLDTAEDAGRTFLSRDAGWSWTQITNSSHFAEFGDHGTVILFAKSLGTSKSVQYTLDQGTTMLECQISDTEMSIRDIKVEPSSENFVIHGERNNKPFLATINFDKIYDRACTDYDYEEFVPTNSADNSKHQCLNGERTVFMRRKAAAPCFVPSGGLPAPKKSACPCLHHDFQCDTCYVRNRYGVCELDSKCTVEKDQYPCINGFKNVTKGYILVGDTKCDYGHPESLKLLPKEMACSSGGDTGKKFLLASMIILIVIVVVAVMVTVSIIVVRNSPRLRRILPAFMVGDGGEEVSGYARQLDLEDIPEDSTAFDESLLEATNPEDDD